MNRIRHLTTFVGLMAIPMWSIWQVISLVRLDRINGALLDANVNSIELLLLLHVLVVITSFIILQHLTAGRSRSTFQNLLRLFHQPITWISASLVFAPSSQSSSTVVARQSEGIPASGLLSPSIAAGALAHVLRRRREQIQQMMSPDRLTLNELQTMEQIQLSAQNCEVSGAEMVDLMSNSEVVQVLRAVDRPLPDQTTQDMVVTEWALVVKLFGYPVVENEAGDIAQFRKRRSLELLTWLALNRDRSRRSAARTAMWDLDITDSTFSTIVSDMRRGLAEIDQHSQRSDWVPTTYSDELPLSVRVITDDVLMAQALESFRKDSRNSSEIIRALSHVRDVPFAGTSYSWADLDGTTTRLIILAITAAMEVALWALATGDMAAFEIAVIAGLRVFPGHEELLALQDEAKLRCHNSGFHSVA
jgi:two-component SAPR family response regulator